MSTVGFVLIGTAPTKEREVYEQLKKLKEISEVHLIYGDYDILTRIEVSNINELTNVVVNKIRVIPGVVTTKTLTGVKL